METLLRTHQNLLRSFNNSSRVGSLRATKILHAIALAASSVTDQTLFLHNSVLSLYASVGDFYSARQVFDLMPLRNEVSYNTLIKAYSKRGSLELAWETFSEMRKVCGLCPTEFTFSGLMCSEKLDIRTAFQIHGFAVKNGLFYSNAFVGTSLFGIYGRLGFVDEALCAFEDMPCKSLVTWNSMLSLLGNHGFVEISASLFRRIMRFEPFFDECSVTGLLSGISSEKNREFGKQIHGLILKLGFVRYTTVMNSLVNMYVKCVGIESAEKVLGEMIVKDVVSWNTIIGVVAKSSRPERAFELFFKMSISGVFPTNTTYFNLITCCIAKRIRIYGEIIHAKVVVNGLQSDVFVGTALVDFYAKCNDLKSSRRCFREIHEPSMVSWNTLLFGYSNKGSSMSMLLLREMLWLGYEPDEFTFSVVLKPLSARELWQVHCLTIRTGYHENRYVLSSLMTSYAKNGLVNKALAFIAPSDENITLLTVPTNISAGIYSRTGQYDQTLKLLAKLDEPDLVSWNIVIEACARKDFYEEAFDLRKEMNVNGISPDNFTFSSLLNLCVTHRNLTLGSSLHGLVVKTGFDSCDSILLNTLINMYSKCGSVLSATKVFDETNKNNNLKDLTLWTSLISSLGSNGHFHEALERFSEMEFLGIKPDAPVLNAALIACRNGGFVTQGTELFRNMRMRYGIEPEIRHYQNVIELLAKTGHKTEVERVISEMPFPPNYAIRRCLLRFGFSHKSEQKLSYFYDMRNPESAVS